MILISLLCEFVTDVCVLCCVRLEIVTNLYRVLCEVVTSIMYHVLCEVVTEMYRVLCAIVF